MYSKLDVVNDMLASLGELPVNDLVTTHPVVQRAIAQIEHATTRLQSSPWWFNQQVITLTPQVGTGYIVIPGNVVSIDSTAKSPAVAARGINLFNLTDNTLVFTAPIECVVRRRWDFEDLPTLARVFVAASARVRFLVGLDGDSQKINDARNDRGEAYAELHAEHIRAVRGNMLHRQGIQRALFRAHGRSPFNRR